MRVRTIFLIIVVFNCSCSYAGKLCFWKRFPDFHDAKEQRKEELVKGFSLLVGGNPLKVHGCFFLHGSSDFGTRGQGQDHLYSVTVIYYGMSAVFLSDWERAVFPRPPDSVSVSIRSDVVKYIYNHKREVKPGDMRDCLEAFFQSSGNQRVTWWSWEKA